MTLVSSGLRTRPVTAHADLRGRGRRFWRTPRWLQRQRNGCVERPGRVAPRVESVDPGPPVTLLVRMLPGQVVDDFAAEAHRVAAGMDVHTVRVTPCSQGLINVALLDPTGR